MLFGEKEEIKKIEVEKRANVHKFKDVFVTKIMQKRYILRLIRVKHKQLADKQK